MQQSLVDLPEGLPRPVDDGAADHLEGMALPQVTLPSTGGGDVTLRSVPGKWVLYVYPMTGRPDQPLPDGWDAIPGARGCTPQSCGFRDHAAELDALGTGVFGLSAQSTDYQREAQTRLRLPFDLLSDNGLVLKSLLGLPTFTVAGMALYKRLTMFVENGRIEKIFYPVFPPDRNAEKVIEWLGSRSDSRDSGVH